jgi:hypothetical protein
MRRPLIGGKYFQTSIGQEKQARGVVSCVFFSGKKEEE